MEGAQQRTEVQYRMMLHLAWHTAYLTRVDHKKFPSLKKHLEQFTAKKPQKVYPNAPVVEPWRVLQDMMRSKAARKNQPDLPYEQPPRKKRKAQPHP